MPSDAPLRGVRPAFPALPGPERTADLCVLGCGFVLATCGALVLIVTTLAGHDHPRRLIAVSVYASGLLAMLGCSLLYRSATEPNRRRFLRRLDHSAIFAMIAGSATPFALIRDSLGGNFAAALLWALAALGIAVKWRFPIGIIWRSAIWYLLLGWAAFFAVGTAISAKTAILIAAGGVLYSAGVPFLLWWRQPYRLATWHLFVLAGAGCHYAAIFVGVVLS